jgi:hypothetical protein
MSTERRLVVAAVPCRCSCACAAVHCWTPVACKGTMPAGSTVGVLLVDGKPVGARCLPCAMAMGWPAAVTPEPMVMAAKAAEAAR